MHIRYPKKDNFAERRNKWWFKFLRKFFGIILRMRMFIFGDFKRKFPKEEDPVYILKRSRTAWENEFEGIELDPVRRLVRIFFNGGFAIPEDLFVAIIPGEDMVLNPEINEVSSKDQRTTLFVPGEGELHYVGISFSVGETRYVSSKTTEAMTTILSSGNQENQETMVN